ncbi:hypothetical protein Sjap_000728 [Stephania japonica]|uniref:Uncharacterized protein n=1 Tax=Stephania japonica TaxID=461633 RepID=A0AAP0PQS8_9MAGN
MWRPQFPHWSATGGHSGPQLATSLPAVSHAELSIINQFLLTLILYVNFCSFNIL